MVNGVLTSVNSVVCVQLMLQTKLFGAVLALVGFVSSVFLSIGLWFVLHDISSSTELTPCKDKANQVKV